MDGYDPNNLIHVYLRRIDEKLDRVVDDIANLQRRMTSVEKSIGELKFDIAEVNHRIDGLGSRLERAERRLELRGDAMRETTQAYRGPDA